MQNNQKKWSDAEKQQLIQLVDKFTINKRTQWVEISKYLDRTANQCKTQFSLVIQQNSAKQCNLQWSLQQKMKLVTDIAIYGKKWKLIKNVDFPDFTTEQLRQKYTHMKSNTQIKEQMIHRIKNFKDIKPNEFSEKQMEVFIWLYDKFCCSNLPYDSLEQRLILKTMGFICDNVDIQEVLSTIYEQLPPTYKHFIQSNSDKK
ncbi:Myb-like_DNA-binding domain-containing protein [Hexamita inflata]|uniref:Myb-like_DNA-binding domain-containing protein n=1 Tax=Hexamita inflata TaxID=28002 RepID=A0ABP1IZV1_9EUKA